MALAPGISIVHDVRGRSMTLARQDVGSRPHGRGKGAAATATGRDRPAKPVDESARVEPSDSNAVPVTTTPAEGRRQLAEPAVASALPPGSTGPAPGHIDRVAGRPTERRLRPAHHRDLGPATPEMARPELGTPRLALNAQDLHAPVAPPQPAPRFARQGRTILPDRTTPAMGPRLSLRTCAVPGPQTRAPGRRVGPLRTFRRPTKAALPVRPPRHGPRAKILRRRILATTRATCPKILRRRIFGPPASGLRPPAPLLCAGRH